MTTAANTPNLQPLNGVVDTAATSATVPNAPSVHLLAEPSMAIDATRSDNPRELDTGIDTGMTSTSMGRSVITAASHTTMSTSLKDQVLTNLALQPTTPLAPIKTHSRDDIAQSPVAKSDVEEDTPLADVTSPVSSTAHAAGLSVKFLVNTAWATAVIGRGGCNVRELSSTTGCHVQLSDKTSFYPGTKSRVLLLRGELPAIQDALAVVLRRRDELPIQAANPTDVDYLSMLVPTRACGELIGNGQIALVERTTGAMIAPAQREKQGPFVPDRVVRITGTRYGGGGSMCG